MCEDNSAFPVKPQFHFLQKQSNLPISAEEKDHGCIPAFTILTLKAISMLGSMFRRDSTFLLLKINIFLKQKANKYVRKKCCSVGKLWHHQAESCTQLELWSQGCFHLYLGSRLAKRALFPPCHTKYVGKTLMRCCSISVVILGIALAHCGKNQAVKQYKKVT